MMTVANPPGPIVATTPGAAGPPLDAVDRGFVARLAARAGRGRSSERIGPAAQDASVPAEVERAVVASGPDRAAEKIATLPTPAAAAVAVAAARPLVDVAASRSPSWLPADPGEEGPLVDRLLHAAAGGWDAIARRVEEAHAAGAFVVAVAGGRRGEGRSTVVACLARTLAARGRDVEVVDRAPVDAGLRADPPIVLVDAGIWFPGGPIRRGRIERESLGCHAAILVRRAGQPPCPARGDVIRAVGLVLLGEVLTRVPADATSAAGG